MQSARVALPALAAASLTVAAAGTAFATDGGSQASSGHLTTGAADTTQWTRGQAQTASRSMSTVASSSAAAKARTAAAAKTRARIDAANKALTAKNFAARRAALGAIDSSNGTMTSYSAPAPKPAAKPAAPAPRVSRSAPAPQAPSTSNGWVRPLSGGTYTSGFGSRWGRLHAGVDFATPIGTTLRAMNDGEITAVGYYGGQGLRVNIRFDNGTEAVYAHMSRATVSVGEHVSAGERLGLSGNTGNSTGPHLHLEIHIGGEPINPYPWLSARGLI
ncbi:M23 family metallopeptidase [Luteipulveratus sp. YIM 133132]|uniref:M23 family metallopeptidase n=1 Tax=Luteipulveratus flavus TaxID=3031728 RepID=A0ABT6C2F7_9MICO|nr:MULTISPECIES: M23 family metallopeptidase [unclassified Luteipulveratus]MDE9367128.1 M23 family metallopeptidase [Luteipulveratus sp. YIM 133132]MDF8263118.1 M23 family metallopeptidase [Luteipulveratus sp. YIM 133296]